MSIDKQKFNTIYNQLKELVENRGAFVIMVTKATEGQGEDMKFEAFGPLATINGLLMIGDQYLQEAMGQKIAALLKPSTRQPD